MSILSGGLGLIHVSGPVYSAEENNVEELSVPKQKSEAGKGGYARPADRALALSKGMQITDKGRTLKTHKGTLGERELTVGIYHIQKVFL